MPVEFVAPAEKLSQGDLIAQVPGVYVRSLAYMVKVDKNRFELRPRPPDTLNTWNDHQANVREASSEPGEDPFGNAMGFRRYGVVLSHDCEIDKPSDRPSVLVALVREMASVHEDDRDRIREDREKRTLYIPTSDYVDQERFVDFRVITTIRREELEKLERVASMTDESRHRLQAQLFRFFVRRVLPEGWEDWEVEAEADAT